MAFALSARARLHALPFIFGLCAAAAAVRATSLTVPVVINEVYYDHPGADAGYEFVELWNTSPVSVDLTGYRLQAGDGAGPSRWRTVWSGQAGDVIAPGSRFVVGEAQVSPAPDRTAPLALENGPDAVRLLAPDGATDVVGWGSLTYAEYFEGSPAPDADAGYSLARSPDGADRDDNLHDFIALSPPTPGLANRPEIDVALIARHPLCLPELVGVGQPISSQAQVVNRGVGPVSPASLRVLLWAASAPSLPPGPGAAEAGIGTDSLVAEMGIADPLEAEDSLAVDLAWAPPASGVYRLSLTARAEEDGVQGNDRTEAFVRAGLGPLLVNEVCYAPAPGEPEWVELQASAEEPVDLSAFTLEDASGRAGRVDPSRAIALLPESLALVTEDAPALLARHPGLDPARVRTLSPWPTLNNAAGSQGEPADRIVLRDARGAPSDAVPYEGGASAGTTIERRETARIGTDSSNWGLSALEGGTPLAPNSILPLPGSGARLSLTPRVWRKADGAPRIVRVAYRLAWERALVRVKVIDARGRERSRLADGPSGATATIEWDGSAAGGERLPPGAYLLALEARPQGGSGSLRLTQPLLVLP